MSHKCQWTGCNRQVVGRFWGCPTHWSQLPKPLRDAICKAYVPGQEDTRRFTTEYAAAFLVAQQWIAGKIDIDPETGKVTKHLNGIVAR